MMTKLRSMIPLTLLLALLLVAGCGDEEGGGGDGGSNTGDGPGPGGAAVVINEVFCKSAIQGSVDWVELYNQGDEAVDLTGWKIRDAKDRDPFVFDGVEIGSGAYVVVERDETGVNGFTFGLGNADAVRLFNPAGEMVDRAYWEDNNLLEDKSLGRSPDGTGEMTILDQPTKGTANAT